MKGEGCKVYPSVLNHSRIEIIIIESAQEIGFLFTKSDFPDTFGDLEHIASRATNSWRVDGITAATEGLYSSVEFPEFCAEVAKTIEGHFK
jgi:hypothetical protein